MVGERSEPALPCERQRAGGHGSGAEPQGIAALAVVLHLVGLGADLVELPRFRRVMQRTPAILERLFTDDERAYAEKRADPTERYAVRFAAKEAVLKAMGAGIGECDFKEIEVRRAESGVPTVVLHGRASALAASRGVGAWLLTLTHTESLAHAIAVALAP